jgi:hypothetical protein
MSAHTLAVFSARKSELVALVAGIDKILAGNLTPNWRKAYTARRAEYVAGIEFCTATLAM